MKGHKESKLFVHIECKSGKERMIAGKYVVA
jgi:hypothetical protein